MKKFLMVLVSVMAFVLPTSAALAGYSAMAGGPGGFAWAEGYRTMASARAAAVRNCRRHGYGSCSVSVAERDSWYFSGGYCNGMPYVGASPRGWRRSDQIVRIKGGADGNYDCYISWRR